MWPGYEIVLLELPRLAPLALTPQLCNEGTKVEQTNWMFSYHEKKYVITKQGRFLIGFFCSGEGPRSRRYGRTAALRLHVQPCDEDEDDDYCPSFSK
jgi:hypothetical protein